MVTGTVTIKRERKSGMVRVRGGFSDTNGIQPCNTAMQTEEFDDPTRVLLSNRLLSMVDIIISGPLKFFNSRNSYYSSTLSSEFSKCMQNDVFCERNTVKTYALSAMLERVNEVILYAPYNEVLDIIEYVTNWVESRMKNHRGCLYKSMNEVFEKEYVGYRLVMGRIVPITDENEKRVIEEAGHIPFDGCRAHIEKAVGFLADRENKDYKNCIKESISAVESACQQIVGDEKATLVIALKKLEDNGVALHPSLKQGFSKLYGYTSDQGGIRHAEGLFESNVTFEEAKYMLVSCSAFVNYLIAVSGKGSN